jgi:hypothetical protein
MNAPAARQRFAPAGLKARGAFAPVEQSDADICKIRTNAKMETLGEPPVAP